jgi:HK97 family phage major capsid protein
MNSANELMQERAAIFAQAQQIWKDCEGNPNGEQAEKYDRMMNDVDGYKEKVENANRREKAERVASELVETQLLRTAEAQTTRSAPLQRQSSPEERNEALRAWALNGTAEARAQDPRLFQRASELGVNVFSNSINLRAGLSVGGVNSGASMVQTTVANEIVQRLKYFSAFKGWVREMASDTVEPLRLPQWDNVGNQASIYLEGSSLIADDSDDPIISDTPPLIVPAGISTPVLTVTYKDLRSTHFDIQGLVVQALGEQIMRMEEAQFCSGTGNGNESIQGINQCPVGTTIANGVGNAISVDNLIDLQTSIDPAYRLSPKLGWFFTNTTWGAIRKIHSDLLYFIQVSAIAGEPDRLLGDPIHIVSSNMDSLTATNFSKKVIVYGAMDNYLWRSYTGGMELIKLVETYAHRREVGFLMHDFATGCYVCQSNSNAVLALQSAGTSLAKPTDAPKAVVNPSPKPAK